MVKLIVKVHKRLLDQPCERARNPPRPLRPLIHHWTPRAVHCAPIVLWRPSQAKMLMLAPIVLLLVARCPLSRRTLSARGLLAVRGLLAWR